MLESYTWSQFFIFLLSGFLLYYLFVAFYYYGEDINRLISGKKQQPALSPSVSPQYAHTAPPIIAESINNQSYGIDEEGEENLSNDVSTDTNSIEAADMPARDTYDWENTKAFTLDYRDATPEEEILLENIDVAEPDTDSDEILEGGIPVEDYVDATIELQKEKIDEEKKEATKSVLRRAYFNASYVELHTMNKNAKSNIDALLTDLKEEGKIPTEEITVYNDFLTNTSGDEDIQALLNTLNN